MEYLTGLMLSLAVAISAAIIGFDRERAFYTTVLIVIASYYVCLLRWELLGAHSSLKSTNTARNPDVHKVPPSKMLTLVTAVRWGPQHSQPRDSTASNFRMEMVSPIYLLRLPQITQAVFSHESYAPWLTE